MRGRACPCVELRADALVPMLEAAHVHVTGTRPGRTPHVAFYPYASTKSTIRIRERQIRLRISDHLQDAPDLVLRGLMQLLVARVLGAPESRIDGEALRAYQEHIEQDKVAARRSESRQARGRKHIDPVGDHRSLLESFMRVVLDHDIRLPEAPTLSWSKTRSRRRFGHHDADHGAIVISKTLDDPDVPEFVLDYVVYHELLHIVIPPRLGSTGKRIVHPKEFKQAERRFKRWQEAEAWLTALASGRNPRRITV